MIEIPNNGQRPELWSKSRKTFSNRDNREISVPGRGLLQAVEKDPVRARAQTDMLKIQLKATMPINTAHPIVRIMAAPNFLIIFLMLIFCKSNLNHK